MTDIGPSTPSASSLVPDSSTAESIAQQDALDTRSASSPTSRKSGSRRKSSPREPGTDCYIVLPSGQMQPVSQAEAIEESRRLASQDSPASHSAMLASALERRITAIYSGKSSESLMRLHLASCGSRTCRGCSPQFVTAQADLFNPHQSATWLDSFPKAAFVADGYLWVRKMSAHHTAANAGGASHGEQWQTPRSARGAYTRDNGDPEKERLTLDGEVQNWATPAVRDVKGANTKPCTSRGRDREDQLANQVVFTAEGEHKAKQQLNPDWEETLMGWDIGWTEPLNFAPQPFPGWPMGQGPNQHPYEPPRTVPKGSCPNRVARVKACGNGVVPQCADAAFTSILAEALA